MTVSFKYHELSTFSSVLFVDDALELPCFFYAWSLLRFVILIFKVWAPFVVLLWYVRKQIVLPIILLLKMFLKILSTHPYWCAQYLSTILFFSHDLIKQLQFAVWVQGLFQVLLCPVFSVILHFLALTTGAEESWSLLTKWYFYLGNR